MLKTCYKNFLPWNDKTENIEGSLQKLSLHYLRKNPYHHRFRSYSRQFDIIHSDRPISPVNIDDNLKQIATKVKYVFSVF